MLIHAEPQLIHVEPQRAAGTSFPGPVLKVDGVTLQYRPPRQLVTSLLHQLRGSRRRPADAALFKTHQSCTGPLTLRSMQR